MCRWSINPTGDARPPDVKGSISGAVTGMLGFGQATAIPETTNGHGIAGPAGIARMKTIGWAAIVYSVHDAYTFGALVVLIAGACSHAAFEAAQTVNAAPPVCGCACTTPAFRDLAPLARKRDRVA